jgi:hypothetical protein
MEFRLELARSSHQGNHSSSASHLVGMLQLLTKSLMGRTSLSGMLLRQRLTVASGIRSMAGMFPLKA